MRCTAFESFSPASSLLAGVLCLSLSGVASAALQGRDVDGVAANGFEAYFDTVLNITWLADANFAQTSGYDADGAMTWDSAMSWVSGLEIQGTSGWRLPHIEPLNGVSFVEDPQLKDGTTDNGFNVRSPKNELSYMYYVNLGLNGLFASDGSLQFGSGINASGQQAIVGLPGSFVSHFKANMYWTDVIYNNDVQKARGFWTNFLAAGASGQDYRYNDHFAWAVHDGDPFKVEVVEPTPTVDEPSTGWLILAGLGIGGYITRGRKLAGANQRFVA